jgi:hypothetical protein
MTVDMKRNNNYFIVIVIVNMFQIVGTNLVERLPKGIKVEF